MVSPHKSWTHDLVAHHTHDNFHSSSWHPLRYKRLALHKWLFGIQSHRGYSHYATYWSDTFFQSAHRGQAGCTLLPLPHTPRVPGGIQGGTIGHWFLPTHSADAVNMVLADVIPTPLLQTQCIRPCRPEAPHMHRVTLPLHPIPLTCSPSPCRSRADKSE